MIRLPEPTVSDPEISQETDVGGFTVSCARSNTALQQLGAEWMDLFYRVGCKNIFLSFEWMAEWWAHWGEGRLFIITVRHPNGRLVALAPLCITSSAVSKVGPRSLGFLASKYVGSDYLNILVEPGIEATAIRKIVRLVAQRRGEWDYIEFANAENDSPMFMQLRRQLRGLGMKEHTVRAFGCPYVILPGSFEEYLAGLGPSVRYNFRRRRRALEREGSLQFTALQGGAELERRFADLVRLHRLRSEQQGRKSSFLEPTVQAFHASMLKRMAAQGWARLYLLQVQEEEVAALYGFSIGKKFSFYQSGMSPAWSRFSVGLVMMGCAIKEAIHSGHEEFDFLRGEESYKFQWTRRARQTLTVRLFDRRFRSQWALARVRLAEKTASVKTMLRQWIVAA